MSATALKRKKILQNQLVAKGQEKIVYEHTAATVQTSSRLKQIESQLKLSSANDHLDTHPYNDSKLEEPKYVDPQRQQILEQILNNKSFYLTRKSKPRQLKMPNLVINSPSPVNQIPQLGMSQTQFIYHKQFMTTKNSTKPSFFKQKKQLVPSQNTINNSRFDRSPKQTIMNQIGSFQFGSFEKRKMSEEPSSFSNQKFKLQQDEPQAFDINNMTASKQFLDLKLPNIENRGRNSAIFSQNSRT